MTINEFKAWLEGYIDATKNAPHSPPEGAQWLAVIGKINSIPATREVDRIAGLGAPFGAQVAGYGDLCGYSAGGMEPTHGKFTT